MAKKDGLFKPKIYAPHSSKNVETPIFGLFWRFFCF
jgi:hypothetical protein